MRHSLPLSSSSARASASKAERPDEYHRGYSVEGFPPGFIDAAQKQADDSLAAWHAMSNEKREAAEKDGRREPKPWDLDQFLIRTKRKKVRSRPYEVEAAASECKALAERAGWTHVIVNELKKTRD